MEGIEFTIDSKEKCKLSRGAKIYHYLFGLFLTTTSLINIYRSMQANSFDTVLYLNYLTLAVGVFWIIRGFIGREYMFTRKYLSLSNDSICLKKIFKDEVQLPKGAIELITIKPSMLSVKTKEWTIDFDLTWISYIELQQLRGSFSAFCSLNKIKIK